MMAGPLVQAHIDMLPQLQAEEALMVVHVTQMGSGVMKEADARRAFRRLQVQAGITNRPAAAKLADLAGMGIAVAQVKR